MAEKSRLTPETIARIWRESPCVKLENGNIRTGLVRVAFCHLYERPQGQNQRGGEKAYGAVLMIPDLALIGADALALLQADVLALYQEKAPVALTNKDLMAKYHNPFKQQKDWIDKKTGALYDGFVPGRIAISANSPASKPPVVDQNGAPILDKALVYSGCWGLAAVRAAWIPAAENPGPTFYMQSFMKVLDDEHLGGVGGGNPQQDFAGVKIDAAVNPVAAFGIDPATAGAAVARASVSAADLLG